MQYGVGVEYALHCLVYFIGSNSAEPIRIKDLAKFQGVSESYLSKIFTKLVKAEILNSIPGVKGGYELTKSPQSISFWDVIQAVEGQKPVFECRNIIGNCIINNEAGCATSLPCRINVTMLEGEKMMQDYFKGKTLLWLRETLDHELPKERLEKTIEWFNQRQ